MPALTVPAAAPRPPAASSRAEPAPAAAAGAAAAPAAGWTGALQRPAEMNPRQAGSLIAGVALLHLAVGWALLQVPAVRSAVMESAPLVVDLLAPTDTPQPPAPPPPPPPSAAPRPPAPVVVPAPVLAAPSPAPVPAEAFTAPAPTPAPTPAPVPVAATAATPSPPAPPAPAPALLPPARKRLAADAVVYRVQPPAELPLASRRAGEHGVVWLRVVVDVRGLPAQVQVQRSSGFARLDAQALAAMRQARFRPYTEDGVALEVEVIAPIEYPLE